MHRPPGYRAADGFELRTLTGSDGRGTLAVPPRRRVTEIPGNGKTMATRQG